MKVINLIIDVLNGISNTISTIFKYKDVYKVMGFFTTRHFKPAVKNHKYAILVAARNEETVIGNLIDSINANDYPRELVTVFVCADNCADLTADAARKMGAVVYERNNQNERTKGYALKYLVECIKRDYGIDSFEGYIIFDADNLLKHDYLKNMNESFDAGEKIITSYRNTKNFGDNWISASYGIHWLRTILSEHRARSVLHLATRIQGTGFLFASEVIRDGWNYVSLTEDRAFCADAVANGYKISYNDKAEFFDEQPVDIKIAMRQRIRWAKGHLQAFYETGGQLFKHIFITSGAANRDIDKTKVPVSKQFLNNIRLRFMSFDMLTVVYPRALFTECKKLLVFALRLILIFNSGLAVTKWFMPKILRWILEFFKIAPENVTGISAAVLLFGLLFAWTADTYLRGILTAIYVFIMEHRRITPIKWYKKIWFCLTFPIFDLIGKLSLFIALFIKVDWKPIPHTANLTIDEITGNKSADMKN